MLVIQTWDGKNINDGTNYKAGFNPALIWGLPPVSVVMNKRTGAWPVYATLDRNAVELSLFVAIEDHLNVRSRRAELLSWFDPEDEAPKRLVVTDDGTANPRYVEAICSEFRPVIINGVAARDLFRANLTIVGDVRWRSTAPTSIVWNITGSPAELVINNTGEDETYPILKFTPSTQRTAGYLYRRWIPIKWQATEGGENYPVMVIIDTAALVTSGKMRADAGDFRFIINGNEVPVHFRNFNTSTTKAWIPLDVRRAPTLVLRTAVPASGPIQSLEFIDEIEVSLLANTGVILVDNEAFVYTGKNVIDATVTGVTRASKGTAEASHAASTPAYWIQNDVYLAYGNSVKPAQGSPSIREPQFDTAASTNTTWIYDGRFGTSLLGERPASWKYHSDITITVDIEARNRGAYTNTELARFPLSPWSLIGVWHRHYSFLNTSWTLANPCGIVNVSWENGKRLKWDGVDQWLARTRFFVRGSSSWSNQYIIPKPTVLDTWQTWSHTGGAEFSPSSAVALVLIWAWGAIETSKVTLNLYQVETPEYSIGAEQTNYHLKPIIRNATIGDSFNLDFLMDLGDSLEVNTEDKTVTLLKDESRHFSALNLSSSRRHWLKLVPGYNTFTFTDVGTGNVQLTVDFERRYF